MNQTEQVVEFIFCADVVHTVKPGTFLEYVLDVIRHWWFCALEAFMMMMDVVL